MSLTSFTSSLIAGIALAAGPLLSQSGQIISPTIQTQKPGATPEPPKGTGLLLGQVVDASTKAPIASAIVSLSGGPVPASGTPPPPPVPGGGQRQVMADSSGRFVFHSLAAGRYSISANAPSYTFGSFGATRPNSAGQAIELTRDDEKRDGIVVRMWKAASITGTVVDEAGEPVVGFSVRGYRRMVSSGRARWSGFNQAVTDDRGVYRMADLTPGEYVVGAMSGTTTLPASVADAFRKEMESGTMSTSPGSISRDLSGSGVSIGMALSGSYRVGEFVMQTSMAGRGGSSGGLPSPPPDATNRLMVYTTQFYPAATTVAQAMIVTLASGEERRSVDLRLKLVPSVRVSGRVVGPEGAAANLGLRLLPAGADDFATESGIEAATTATDAAGMFTFLGVTPGPYTLKALRVPRPLPIARQPTSMIEVSGPGGAIMGFSSGIGMDRPAPPPLPPDSTLYFVQPLTVSDADVNGVLVTLRSGAKLSGRIVFEGAEAPSPDEIQQTQLSISPFGPSMAQVSSAPKRVEPDGQFSTVGFPPGRYTLSAFLSSMSMPVGTPWRFKSATVGGRDVADEGFEVAGEDLTTIVVTFTKHPPSEINGTVKNDRGEPDQAASVVIVPADSDAWRRGIITTRRIRTARVGTTGAYRFADVPPGAYFIAAVRDDELENYQTTRVLEAISRVAVHVTVREQGTVTQALTTKAIR